MKFSDFNGSGLEYLLALKNKEIAISPMSQTVPMQVNDAREGMIEYLVTPDERHTNVQGAIHGGFAAVVMDTITGGAVHTTLPKGVSFATLDLNVKMIRPIQTNTTYKAIGEVINTGRNVLTSEGRIVDENGKVFAYGSATLMVTKRPE